MAHSFRNLLIIALVSFTGAAAAQDAPDIAVMKALPINLDAQSSEFDRKKNRLFFRNLTITQGPLSIKADEATATRLDFENGHWEFSGSVVIKYEATTAYCDHAEILFNEHRVRNALMQGQPVRFEQLSISEGKKTDGRANTMEYDVDAGIIRMSDDAWLSDGSNEVSGNRISYDLERQYIIADADDDGQVRMKIIPPENNLSKIEDHVKP